MSLNVAISLKVASQKVTKRSVRSLIKLSMIAAGSTMMILAMNSSLVAQDCGDGCQQCDHCQNKTMSLKQASSLEDIPIFNFVKPKRSETNVAVPDGGTFISGVKTSPDLYQRIKLPNINTPRPVAESGYSSRPVAESVYPSGWRIASATSTQNEPHACQGNCDAACCQEKPLKPSASVQTISDSHQAIARDLVDKIANSDCDIEQATDMIRATLDKVALDSQFAASIQVERIRAQHAQEQKSMQQVVFSSQQNQLAMQFQQKLAPINYRQDRTQQMMIEFETRLLEMQQTIHKMQQQARSNTPTIKFTQKQVEPNQKGRCPTCNDPFHIVSHPAVDRDGNPVFRTIRMCRCDHENRLPAPSTTTPLDSPPVFPTHDRSSFLQLQQRIQELEQQVQLVRGNANIMQNPRQPNRFVEQASYEEDENPLIPSPTTAQPLIPVPVESFNSDRIDPAQHSRFIPREETTHHNWFSKTYYIGDLMPMPNWNDKDRNGQAYEDYADKLMETIIGNVEPDSWINNPFAKIRFLPHTLSIRVMQTHTNHQEIDAMIEQARDDESVFSFYFNVNR